MACKIFFCSEFTVLIPRYPGKMVVRRRRGESITKRYAFKANALTNQIIIKKSKQLDV